jgi:hypothetical protein
MSIALTTFGSDRRLVLGNAEAIRQPIYMGYVGKVGTADAGTDVITSAAHGLVLNTKILVLGATPPAGLTTGFYYFARDITTNTFKVSATSGGAAIDLTTTGTSWTFVKVEWTTMQIGIRLAIDATGSLAGTPRLAFGLCSGSNGYGSVSSSLVIGTRTGGMGAYHAGPPAYFETDGNIPYFKKVGAVFTNYTSGGPAQFAMSSDTASRCALFLTITRANTNYSLHSGGPITNAGAQSDVTDNQFLQMMEIPSMPSLVGVKTGYGQMSAAVNVPVDENDGVLDHLFVYWDRSSTPMGFDIKHRLVA